MFVQQAHHVQRSVTGSGPRDLKSGTSASKSDPVTHTTYMDTAMAQPAAVALDSHLTAAAETAAGKKTAGGPLSAAASVSPRPATKAKSWHVVHWRLEDWQVCLP